MIAAPRLETARLALRAPAAADWEPWAAFYVSERGRFVGGEERDREKAWRAFATVIGHWLLRGYGSFVFTFRNEDAALGLVGPWYPEGWPEREIGWSVLSAENEGRGLAAEAAVAARDHTFDVLGWPTAVSYIDRGNARSMALARRLGAVEDPDAPRRDAADLVFRHPAPEQRQ